MQPTRTLAQQRATAQMVAAGRARRAAKRRDGQRRTHHESMGSTDYEESIAMLRDACIGSWRI